MTNAQSKLFTTVSCTCKEFQHPWTERCVNASAGLLLACTPYCLRIYTVVYALSLIMRQRIPTLNDLKKTLAGIVRSSGFLVTNSIAFVLFNCILRNYIGKYYQLTVAFLPAFLASLAAIVIERPARRPLLALYVANVATETVWNMAESRGLVRSLPHGQTVIFGISISVLLYLYRLGLHKSSCKDSLFSILRIFVGKTEEGPVRYVMSPIVPPASALEFDGMQPEESDDGEVVSSTTSERSRRPIDIRSITDLVQIYSRFVDALKSKHASCAHSKSCLHYAFTGGLRPFIGGISLQVALKLLINMKKIAQFKMNWRKQIFDRSTLRLGIFLGSFSFLYKAVSCILRHSFDYDHPLFAIPAGLIGSVAFTQYPDTTVALYVMWKMLQIVYNLGIEKKKVPKISGFTIFLYCFSTAMLFHAGILEPKTLRHSYYKFLQAISGERLGNFNFVPLDAWGKNTSQNAKEVLETLHLTSKTNLPKFPFSF